MTKSRAATIHLSFGGVGTFPSSKENFDADSSVKMTTTARVLKWHLNGDDRPPLYIKDGQLHGDDGVQSAQHPQTVDSGGRQTKVIIFQRLVAHNQHLIEVLP